MTKRKFYKYEVSITVLSEDPIDNIDNAFLEVAETVEGAVITNSFVQMTEELNGKETVEALYECNSEPSFFMLDDNGNDTE